MDDEKCAGSGCVRGRWPQLCDCGRGTDGSPRESTWFGDAPPDMPEVKEKRGLGLGRTLLVA
jgi:hypothetical protein